MHRFLAVPLRHLPLPLPPQDTWQEAGKKKEKKIEKEEKHYKVKVRETVPMSKQLSFTQSKILFTQSGYRLRNAMRSAFEAFLYSSGPIH